jgi:hypothetical protein
MSNAKRPGVRLSSGALVWRLYKTEMRSWQEPRRIKSRFPLRLRDMVFQNNVVAKPNRH